MTRPDVSNPHRVTVQNHVAAALAAGMLAAGAAVASSATAAADPPLPLPPPAPADPAPAPTGFLPPAGTLQSFLPEGGMAPGSGYDFLLGQAPMPTASGGQAAPVIVGADGQPVPAAQSPTFLDQQAIQPLKPTNFALAGQGQQSFYSNTPAAPGAPPPGFLENAKGAHGIWNYQMGKLTPDQLGQPLPGTAPPPGTKFRWVSVRASRIPRRRHLRHRHQGRRRSFRHRPAERHRDYRPTEIVWRRTTRSGAGSQIPLQRNVVHEALTHRSRRRRCWHRRAGSDSVMRVVQVANFYGPRSGGLRTAVDRLGAEYCAAGHEVFLIVPGQHPDRVELPIGGHPDLAARQADSIHRRLPCRVAETGDGAAGRAGTGRHRGI